jgi:NAD(P)-dependent dehydrogenase (short-subunit alcohol dehydrogenase family)
MPPELPLSGRTALVTGASRGIGAATVRALRARGAEVVAFSRPPFADEPDPDPGVHCYNADVGDWASVSAAVRSVLTDHPVIDVLVNNAGMGGVRGPVWELDVDTFRERAAVNSLGPFYLMRLVMPGMVARRDGVVLNVVSGAADRPRPNRGMYGSQKAAAEHLTRAAAHEAAEHGIRVYAFHPGPVDTALFAASRSEAELARLRAGGDDGPPLQNPAEPAAALAWLASPAGAAWTDVVVPWREPQVRAALRARPDFASDGGEHASTSDHG